MVQFFWQKGGRRTQLTLDKFDSCWKTHTGDCNLFIGSHLHDSFVFFEHIFEPIHTSDCKIR